MSKKVIESRLPIAILTDDIKHGLQWAMTNYPGELDKYLNAKRQITMVNGQKIIICSRPEHLIGLEISHWLNAGSITKPETYMQKLIELAETRIR